nr:hypothetical protein [uncultured Sharpea sp.]
MKLILSIIIYSIQILIFDDPRTTFFYILQDLAFMPITIAFATLMVGEVLNWREKNERKEKTRMLTSTFFTEIGAILAHYTLSMTQEDDFLHLVARNGGNIDNMTADEIIQKLEHHKIKVKLNKEGYEKARNLILSNQTNLLVISSNPLILEHEYFTEMLWGVFHLIDEFRLRGEWDALSKTDIAHLNVDFAKVLRLMLINWIGNSEYLAKNYPAFYNVAFNKLDY